MASDDFDIVWLGAASLEDKTNLPAVQAINPAGDTEDDFEDYGQIDMACALGVTALPWPKDAKGAAEGVVLRSCAGTDGLCVGGRDKRCAKVYGKLQPGDTDLHSTDPDASAQVMAKANRQILLATKDSHGDNMMFALDGKNDKVQLPVFGAMVEITPEHVYIMEPSGKASIMMKDGNIILSGKVMLGGITPTAVLICTDPASITAIQAIIPQIKAAGNVFGQLM